MSQAQCLLGDDEIESAPDTFVSTCCICADQFAGGPQNIEDWDDCYEVQVVCEVCRHRNIQYQNLKKETDDG